MTTSTTITTIAQQINEHHEACRTAIQSAVKHAIRAGKLLIEAKAQCIHGEWMEWVEINCTFSDRTARAYMKLAREFPTLGNAKRQRVANLSLRDALKALEAPSWSSPVPSTKEPAAEVSIETALAYFEEPATSREHGLKKIREWEVFIYQVAASAYRAAREECPDWPEGSDAAWADEAGIEHGQASVLSRLWGTELWDTPQTWGEARSVVLSTISEAVTGLRELERQINSALEDGGA